MWQQEAVASGTDAAVNEFLTSIEALATSDHVSAAAINAGGTGHAVDDVITITHASAHHDLTILVTAVSGGVITAARILNGGAFGERVASAVVGAAAGSGYVIGDVLEVQDGAGASRQKAKLKVATLSGSAVATVTVFESGGYYGTTPTITDAATIGVGPTAYAGDDVANFDLTMQTIIGTSAIAQSSTSGSGISSTWNLTLTASGWSIKYSHNDLTVDSLVDRKQVVMEGTVAGGNTPFIGFHEFRADSGGQKRWGFAMFGMTAWNSGLALTAQPGIGPLAFVTGSTTGAQLLMTEEVAENNIWGVSITPRRICGFARGNIAAAADSYHTFYVGLMNGLGPATTTPYPMFVGGSSNVSNRRTSDAEHTGLAEAFQSPSGGGPLYYLRRTDLTWITVRNATTPTTTRGDEIMWPRGVMNEAAGADLMVEDDNYRMLDDGIIGSRVRANVVGKIYPTPGSTNIFTVLPLTVVSTGGSSTNGINTTIVGELEGCFFVGGVTAAGVAFTAEDILEQAGDRYIIIPCNVTSLANRPYQFMLIRQD